MLGMSSSQRGGALFGKDYGSAYQNYMVDTGVNSGVIQYLFYFIMLTIIILLVLVLVHYLVTPIFITKPGAKGYIPLPGSDDSAVYWKTAQDTVPISDTSTPIGNSIQNYSFTLDIQVDNPTANTQSPRVLLVRGPQLKSFTGIYTDQDTIQRVISDFNVIVYLDRMTNDLNVCVQTTSGSGTNQTVFLENILVPNLPVRKTVRLGVMVGNKVLEVYINGWLARSITYSNSLKAVVGDFQPPLGNVVATTARVRNLRLWNRILSPAEFRHYGKAEDFDLKDISDSCSS
jgi:hypothetical protein